MKLTNIRDQTCGVSQWKTHRGCIYLTNDFRYFLFQENCFFLSKTLGSLTAKHWNPINAISSQMRIQQFELLLSIRKLPSIYYNNCFHHYCNPSKVGTHLQKQWESAEIHLPTPNASQRSERSKHEESSISQHIIQPINKMILWNFETIWYSYCSHYYYHTYHSP